MRNLSTYRHRILDQSVILYVKFSFLQGCYPNSTDYYPFTLERVSFCFVSAKLGPLMIFPVTASLEETKKFGTKERTKAQTMHIRRKLYHIFILNDLMASINYE